MSAFKDYNFIPKCLAGCSMLIFCGLLFLLFIMPTSPKPSSKQHNTSFVESVWHDSIYYGRIIDIDGERYSLPSEGGVIKLEKTK